MHMGEAAKGGESSENRMFFHSQVVCVEVYYFGANYMGLIIGFGLSVSHTNVTQ